MNTIFADKKNGKVRNEKRGRYGNELVRSRRWCGDEWQV